MYCAANCYQSLTAHLLGGEAFLLVGQVSYSLALALALAAVFVLRMMIFTFL